jgi:predicted ester cyclase
MASSGDVVLRHIEAFNARDHDADPWAGDAEIVAPGGAFSGRGNVLNFLGAFQQAFPNGRLEAKKLLVDGPSVAVEGVFTGTHDGALPSPEGDVPATHREVAFRWAAVYAVKGDDLASEHLFFDQMDLLGQLGLLPG